MTNFTKEEISLCKQVAEKYRKDIKYGDWYWSSAYPKILLAMDYGFKAKDQEHSGVFKIWTISGCLEFLRKNPQNKLVQIVWDDPRIKGHISVHPYGIHEGKTLLEAFLRVVLAVLEEKKK